MASAVLNASPVTSELDLDGLDSVLGLHIGMLNSLFVAHLERRLDRLSVTPKQVAILWLVNANPGIRQSDLSRFFQIERPTVHQFVRQLLRNDFIVNEPSKLDRRAGGLWITEEGARVLGEARVDIADHETNLTSSITAREKAELFRIIAKLSSGAPPKS